MERVTATRTELVALRERIALAQRSRDLLEDKRSELVKELRRAAGAMLEGSDALERAAAESRRVLSLALGADGPEAVGSAALAAQRELALEARPTVVMGVRVPEIGGPPLRRSLTARGYSLGGTSPRIDVVAERFERELELALEVAARELRVRELGREIANVTRRVNALEHRLIPALHDEAARIESILDERERQDHFRLKRMKVQRSRRGEAA